MKFIRKNFFLLILIAFSLLVLGINVRINLFRYNNFDYGKFDLGNMTQMVWNTLHGRFLYVTDYFGTNMPRWGMSHVDPILVVFVPLFAIFQSPLTLVFSQLVLVIFSCLIVYKLAVLELKSTLVGLLMGLSYLLYPAVGYLTATTGFHGVTAVIPFFLLAFYIFEHMYLSKKFTQKGWILFWIMLVLAMMGKEQVPLYIALYGAFIVLFRSQINFKSFSKKDLLNLFKSSPVRVGLSMIVVGFLWFMVAFFVLIPANAHYRIEGFNKFAASIGLDTNVIRDVSNPNYFISRYEGFGDSYTSVFFNMLINPKLLISVFFGGDKVDNFVKTLAPVGFLPFLYPVIFIIAGPDFLINYSTTAGGIGTAEITNHRVSMIIPVIFISTIFSIDLLSRVLSKLIKRKFVTYKVVAIFISSIVLGLSIYTTFAYNNPVYLWLTQAIQKRVALAKEDSITSKNADLKVGDVLRLSKLENKDRECAEKIIGLIPNNASVSGPDYLGAHLSMRETYAIFPALYNEADYVIVDVFSKKILTILDVDISLVRDVVGELIKNPEYDLINGCGNLFVFKKVGLHNKSQLLPLQERFEYKATLDHEIFQSLHVVDYTLPKEIKRGDTSLAKFVYIKKGNNNLDDYVLFMTFIRRDTGEIYQVANLPSFAITQLREWTQDHYYIEDVQLTIPTYLKSGSYEAFIGISNVIRTRSIYLGDIQVK